ncbi:hypothetical protein LTR85_001744 [Meristemomyces frigidus]|nr:hypothetical protein LTR85_001744 [Meristemomyces frigidus]
MVQLTITSAAGLAIAEYCRQKKARQDHDGQAKAFDLEELSKADIGSPIDHHDLLEISKYLVRNSKTSDEAVGPAAARAWRLDILLRGATVYQPPPPPKKEPTPEYKALMRRLRQQEEERQYERMINPVHPPETFGQRFPSAAYAFNPATSHGASAADEVDDVTYADVNRQMILIINVLISIITCSVFIWVAARRWSVPSRLGLSMSGSGLVAAAEVAIYMGYIRRLNDARQKEVKKVEQKEIVETWVLLSTLLRIKIATLMMAPTDYHHPYQPYDIQQQFMDAMYACIEDGNVGIFESPTGTGKSLSLICSSLTWLREHKRKEFDEGVAAIDVDDDEPDWMAEHARDARQREMRQMREDLEARLQSVREREDRARERHANVEPQHKRRKVALDAELTLAQEDEQYMLDEYESEDDRTKPGSGTKSEYSTETTKLMERLGMIQTKKQDSADVDIDELKVFFCSRTHSQLSQFVGELQRVKLPPGMPPEPNATAPSDDTQAPEPVKQLSLGSRKNLCINPKVTKLGNQTAINERCIELQQSSTPAEHKCPFLPNKENEDLVLDFRDHALAKIRDIEDLANVGARLAICPYYASRPAIGQAEMVTLPYPLLLQKSARDALGISVKGHVVVIDEAHNLMNAIEGIYSTQISETQLRLARESLMVYLQRFRNRLKGSNRVYVTQVVRIIDSLLSFISTLGGVAATGGTLEPGQLLAGKAVDQVNLSKLVRYISDSKLARKVEGYASTVTAAQSVLTARTKAVQTTSDVPTLTHLQNFLMTLMNPSAEGRFFWSKEENTTIVRYMLLDPSEHFRDIVRDARAVILAGGTMSPMDDYKQQLFPYLTSLETFSCGHLIPAGNLLVRSIAADGEGALELNYKSRDTFTFTRIGKALLAIAPYVRGGLVVFMPSYGFLEQVAESWRSQSIAADLQKHKPIFWDSRAGSAEATFKAYSEAITAGQKGAVLLSVIGGKLSEGINFSDDLGRCVVVVGLPFPNLHTPEWKAKMQYIDSKAMARGEPKGKASREHAENVCMRSVNQAIGRVIRHKDDWASIILMDSRYTQQRIRAKLPGWMKESAPSDSPTNVQKVAEDVRGFFSRKG